MVAIPRILIVDHHDSYTLNLLSLLLPSSQANNHQVEEERAYLAQQLSKRVVVLPHTHPLLHGDQFYRHVRPFIDAIILSPGPGSPEKAQDFGAAENLLKDPKLDLPVLGVCLGHQGLATAFGGRTIRARSVRHGLKSGLKLVKQQLNSNPGVCLLARVPEDAQVVRYNSLIVDEASLPDCLEVTAWGYDERCSASPPRPRSHLEPSIKASLLIPNNVVMESIPSSSASSVCAWSNTDSSANPLQLPNLNKIRDSDSSSLGESQDDLEIQDEVDLERVILALQHKSLPLYGVQFHPESIESNFGRQMMENFLQIVHRFWSDRAVLRKHEGYKDVLARLNGWDQENLTFPKELCVAGEKCMTVGSLLDNTDSKPSQSASNSDIKGLQVISERFKTENSVSKTLLPRVFELLFRNRSKAGAAWLDSARPRDPHSRYSYMALPCFSLSYYSSSGRLQVCANGNISDSVEIRLNRTQTLWDFINELQTELKCLTDFENCHQETITPAHLVPQGGRSYGSLFRTGFVGYWGYEMKKESLGLEDGSAYNDDIPDAEFFFCNEVLVFDHHNKEWTAFVLSRNQDVQVDLEGQASTSALTVIEKALSTLQTKGQNAFIGCTKSAAKEWLQEVSITVQNAASSTDSFSDSTSLSTESLHDILPRLKPALGSEEYKDQIESAREFIAAGESYELCMTTQFQATLPPIGIRKDLDDTDHFGLYLKLRARNPAPYSAFLRLPSLETVDPTNSSTTPRSRSIVSTSPERFMRITRDGDVEMKPIKGTLARAGYGPGEEEMRAGQGTTKEEEYEKTQWREREDMRRREKLSVDIKERAENLMIVDLIRADLLSFCQPNSVTVPSLMSVESYETVHQLVTTVCGKLKDGVGTTEAVRRCFPPGSMTGAPKRRSVQLLERLELALADAQREANLRACRGIYSGALGWMGLDGAADFAVVIRTMVADGDQISIGAGGAITYLSDPAKEWQEVLDKVGALANITN